MRVCLDRSVSPAMPAGAWLRREGQGGRGVGELPHPEFAIANPDAHRLFMGWRELYVFLFCGLSHRHVLDRMTGIKNEIPATSTLLLQ